MRTLSVQYFNGRSQNEKDGFHCASGKIQVGYIEPSAVQSGTRARRFPLVSSPRGTSRWEKVRRR